MTDFFKAVISGEVNRVKELLREYPDLVNSRDESGVTPLHGACYYGNLEIAELLISKGAQINAVNEWDCTPLHDACRTNHLGIVRLLIASGADPTLKDKNNKTAHEATMNDEIRRILKDATMQIAECVSISASGDIAAVKRLLQDAPHLLNGMNNKNIDGVNIIKIRDVAIDDSGRISSTAYSIVYRGTFRGTVVALKMIRGDGGMHVSARNMQKTEIELLSSLRHPRVLTLMGVVLDLDPRYGAMCGLVTEYMTRGSLYSVLHKAETPSEHRLASLSLKLRVLRDLAEGMRFLHSSNVIHRDLKSLNVLLDEEGRAKICDFGVSKIMSMDATHASTTGIGTPAWSSPEALLGDAGGICQSSDVYSFGVILWEMLTNAIPWNGLTAIQLGVRISRGESLPIPAASEDAPQELIDILQRCLNRNPDVRPTFECNYEIITQLLTSCHEPCPLEYLCPISHEIMHDPVICSDGQTYERANIECWLKNHDTSPISNAVLDDMSLRPNIILRGFIQSFLTKYAH